VTVTAEPAATAEDGSLLDPRFRLPIIGLVIVITVGAVEAMSVATVMPTVARSLHGLRFYSWGFTAFLLADVIGMVDAGRRCDRHGPRPSLLGGLSVFAAGLIVASAAPDMTVFLLGRVLQGLGGGAMIVAAYVVVAHAFPERLHAKVFGVLAAAWVVPSLVGPAVAGVVASTLSWRWVFAGIAPLAVGGAALLIPVLRSIPPGAGERTAAPGRLRTGIMLATGLGLVQGAAQAVDWWSLPLLVAGLVLVIVPLRRLLPAGALRLAPGLPTVIVLRAIVSCAFFGAEAYLPLTLTRLHHGTPREVGIPLTLAALGWTAGSWWQGRRQRSPVVVIRAGYITVAVGVALLAVMASAAVSLWLAVPIWALAGAGMGIVMPTLSVLVLNLSPPGGQGANAAAFQISDMVGSIAGIAGASALVTGFGLRHLATSVTIADGVLAGVAPVGACAVTRAGHFEPMPTA
jgi:MFS family permease